MGSGSPATGMSPVTDAMLISACVVMVMVSPPATMRA